MGTVFREVVAGSDEVVVALAVIGPYEPVEVAVIKTLLLDVTGNWELASVGAMHEEAESHWLEDPYDDTAHTEMGNTSSEKRIIIIVVMRRERLSNNVGQMHRSDQRLGGMFTSDLTYLLLTKHGVKRQT